MYSVFRQRLRQSGVCVTYYSLNAWGASGSCKTVRLGRRKVARAHKTCAVSVSTVFVWARIVPLAMIHLLAEGEYTTILHIFCACAGSLGEFGLFSMQFKHCLKRRHGLDNHFSNKFKTPISLGWRSSTVPSKMHQKGNLFELSSLKHKWQNINLFSNFMSYLRIK